MWRPVGLAICLLLPLAATLPATAAADWTEPRPVAGERATAPVIPPLAVNERGEAALAWTETAGVRVAMRRAGASTFARPVTIPGSARASEPLVAINSRGDVAVAWWTFDRSCGCTVVAGSAKRTGRAFRRGEVVSLRGDSAEGHAVAIGPGGTAGVTWRSGAGVEASFAHRGGAFGAPVRISRYEPGLQSTLAFDGRDRATAFWRIGSRDTERLRYARRDPNGRVSSARTAAGPSGGSTGFHFMDFRAGTDSAGRHVLAWNTTADFGPERIEAAVADRSGRFGPRQTLATAGTDIAASVFWADLDVAASGAAAVAWRRSDSNAAHAELAVRRSAGAAFTVRAVPGSDNAYRPNVAVAGSGRTALAWPSQSDVVATVGEADGTLLEPRRFPGTGSLPAVGVDRDGEALVVWHTARGLVFADFRRGS